MTYNPTPERKPRRRLTGLWIAIAFVVLGMLLLCCAGAVSNFGDNRKAEKIVDLPSAEQTTSAQAETPRVTPTVMLPGDYEVGSKVDIAALMISPGTYAVSTSSHCYWERLRGFSGEFSDIISNGNVTDGQVARVTVKKTDKGLRLGDGCAAKRLK